MSIDGTYNIEVDTPMGKMESKLTLKSAGTALSGTVESSFGTTSFTGGTVKGDDVAWTMEIDSPMGKMKLDYIGKVTGSDISGEVKAGDFGSSPFKGKRI
jgi:hypothetical protein